MDPLVRYAEIADHYHKSMGQEAGILKIDQAYEVAPSPVWVMEFAPPSEEYDWVYSTIGMSFEPMPGAINDSKSSNNTYNPYVELMIYSKQRHEDLVDLLGRLAAYPFVENTFFAPGHIVAGNDAGVVSGSPLTEILLTQPFFEEPEFYTIHHADGTHTHVLWIMPLYLSERLFARQNGYMALIERFSENSTDTSELWRSPVV